MSRYTYKSIIGKLLIQTDDNGLKSLSITNEDYFDKDRYIEDTIKWLDLYFNNQNPDFIPRLSLDVSLFRSKVYDILLSIPYGKTITYKEVAKRISSKMSSQAIGQACKYNPIMLIVPCHRVVASHGLGGYAYGLEIKKYLLDLETKQSI